MKLKFGLELYPRKSNIGCLVYFHRDIDKEWKGLQQFKNKTYRILDEDNKLHLFKISRGDIWISKYVVDGRLGKLIARYQQL